MWPNPQETADLVTFTEEILDGKLHFLCSVKTWSHYLVETLLNFIWYLMKHSILATQGYMVHFSVLFCQMTWLSTCGTMKRIYTWLYSGEGLGLLNGIQWLAWFDNKSSGLSCICRDPVKPVCVHLQAPYRQENLNRGQMNYNKAMSTVWVTVEWLFGETKTFYGFFNFKWQLNIWSKFCWKDVFSMWDFTKYQDLFILQQKGCLCDNWKPGLLPLLIFNWRAFSRRVTTRWWRQWAKNRVFTNQNLRDRCCQVVRRTICKVVHFREYSVKYFVNAQRRISSCFKVIHR